MPRSSTLTSHLSRVDANSTVYNVVCAGFGPASLAIAVALHDAVEAGRVSEAPKVVFLEKQAKFAWHAGMLLPGAKMQISFIKDLASLRDPRSNFTFLNYLHRAGRLVEFSNLSTFLPARAEYEDYLRWCAGHFDDLVQYGAEVLSVAPVAPESSQSDGAIRIFAVTWRDVHSGAMATYHTRNVILATGGRPSIPPSLPAHHPRVIHSSQFTHIASRMLNNPGAPYRVVVIGAGQSAAEIFCNVQNLYANSRTWLIMRSAYLKPSDDSPFVNSIFNPEFVDELYPCSPAFRRHLTFEAKATNYGVVRLELIERLYERMYDQRREMGRDESTWPHRLMGGRQITTIEELPDNSLRLHVAAVTPDEDDSDEVAPAAGDVETIEADLVVAATGYQRDAHLDIMKDSWHLLPEQLAPLTMNGRPGRELVDGWEVRTTTTDSYGAQSTTSRLLQVGRDYKVRFARNTVAPGSGIWLQGCCEQTHGLSDTLLSVLATRSGEIVDSIFREDAATKSK